jgi:hypothetical protein
MRDTRNFAGFAHVLEQGGGMNNGNAVYLRWLLRV